MIALLPTLSVAVSLWNPVRGLEDYVGKDLTRMSEANKALFDKQVQAMTGDKPGANLIEMWKPQFIKRYRAGRIEWLAFYATEYVMHPSASALKAFLFDEHWKLLSKIVVPIGYRQSFAGARLRADPWLAQPLLTVRVQGEGPYVSVGGGKFKSLVPEMVQTYAFDERGIYLIRLADGTGRIMGNSYQADEPMIGPPVSKRSEKDWHADLFSADPVRQLACLVWLGGAHLNSKDWRRKDYSREPVGESKAYEILRNDEEVHARLKRLAGSANPWLQKQAVLTLIEVGKPLAPVEDRPPF